MRIILVNSLLPPHGTGGAERSVAELAVGLADAGHEVLALALGPESDPPVTVPYGAVRILRLPTPRFTAFTDAPRSAADKALWHLGDLAHRRAQRFLRTAVTAFAPDVVHTHNLAGFGLGSWSAIPDEVPLVHTVRDYHLLCARSRLRRDDTDCATVCTSCAVLRLPLRGPGRRPDTVVGISEYVLRSHDRIPRLARVPGIVIHNQPRVAVRPRRAAGEQLRVGFLGELTAEKGIWTAVEAFRAVAGDTWTLEIGGRAAEDTVAELAVRSGDDPRITHHGVVDAADFLAGIDILLVPARWAEPYGRVAAEGLLAGCRVLVSAVGGLPEVVAQYGRGTVVAPASDVTAWSRALAEAAAAHRTSPRVGSCSSNRT